jgi:hypothetical protein
MSIIVKNIIFLEFLPGEWAYLHHYVPQKNSQWAKLWLYFIGAHFTNLFSSLEGVLVKRP